MDECFRSPVIKYLRKSFPFIKSFDSQMYSALLKNPRCNVPDNMKDFLIPLLDKEFEYDAYAKKYLAVRLHENDIMLIYLTFLRRRTGEEDATDIRRESVIEILESYSKKVIDLRDYRRCDILFEKACELFIEECDRLNKK